MRLAYYYFEMKKPLITLLTATATLALSSAFSSANAQAVSMARYIPSDALLTLELGDFAAAQKQMGMVAKDLDKLDIFALSGTPWPAEAKKMGIAGPMDFISRGGVVSLHFAAKTMQPQVLAVAQPKAGLDKAMGKMISEAMKPTKGKKIISLKEGAFRFYQEGADSFYGYQNGIAYISNDANLLRGFLRRLGGSKETNLMQSAAYNNVMNSAGNGVVRAYLNFAAVGDVVKSFADLQGMKEGVDIANSLRTLGQFGGSIALTPAGIASNSVMIPNKNGGDTALYNLIIPKGQNFALPAQVPANLTSFSAGQLDLQGIYGYLDAWVTRLGGKGTPSLNDLSSQTLNIDLQKNLLSWVGSEYAAVSFKTASSAKADPSDPMAALAGTAFYIKTKDEAAAKAGMTTLVDAIIEQAANVSNALPSTTGTGKIAKPKTAGSKPVKAVTTLEGTEVTSLISEGSGVWYAIKNSTMIVAFSSDDMKRALVGGPRLADDAGFKANMAKMPSNLSSLSYGPKPAIMNRLEIRQQVETVMATSSSNMSLAQRNKLSTGLVDFVDAVQKRFGTSSGYTAFQNGKIVTKGLQEVTWK
jgi:hypothetical protein